MDFLTRFSALAGVVFLVVSALAAHAQTNRVGVGTTSSRAGLDVSHLDGIVATGTDNQGTTDNLPTDGGTRLLWIPRKAAFRAGRVNGSEWDYGNIGGFSTAMGENTVASGNYSTALGNYVRTNSQEGSFILGDQSTSDATNRSATNQFTARFASEWGTVPPKNRPDAVG